MTYDEALKHKKILNEKVDYYSKRLNEFSSGKMGLIDETVRNSKDYIEVKNNYEKSFSELRNFNSWFVKEFRRKRKSK
jgi:hypothetical protein